MLLFIITLAVDGGVQEWSQAQIYGTGEPLTLNIMEFLWGETKSPDTEPVTMLVFGDMMLGRYVWTLMQYNGHDYPFEYFDELKNEMLIDENGEVIPDPDFMMANLEGPISDSDYVNPGTAMTFNFRPEVTETLTKYGFNLLNLANNHAYDMGTYGADQTRINLAAAGIHHFGDAQSIREESVWVTTVDETTLSFIGLNDTVQDHLDYSAALDLIESLEEESDFTIVVIHWGAEYRTTPTGEQVNYAHQFVEAGADVIIGHHPHVIEYANKEANQIAEWYEGADGVGRPIYYSLGNFIFDQYFQQNVQEGLGLTLTLKKSLDPDEPIQISVEETVFDIIKSQVKVR